MEGLYYDPLHGHCLRAIRRTGLETYRIVGVYGDDECPYTHLPWTAEMRLLHRAEGGEVFRVDFRGKPLKANRYMTAVFRARSLHWIEDGNVWRQLYTHPVQTAM